ncbi:interferon-gamma-inducible GTPase 10-like [Mytilus trossulus]|uniref:interferon-gamma-inducible GTPase 10-like n=1 Tax=Mytilus trossulus TaxID=6551 RepID=UPI003007758D
MYQYISFCFADKVFKSLDIDEIANTLVSGGTKEEFRKIYQEKIESWKVKDVKFCITGGSRTGKSSFINAITGCQKGQKGFATVSVYGDTTNKAACYTHPKHSKFQLWDLPRFGTVQHKSEGYVNDMEFTKFDYVLIFFDVISENDIWLAKQLKRLMKSFCFVRSKLDQDITNEMQHDCNTIACNIRTKALGDLEKEQISGVDVFVISSADTTIGNFESLINHMENNLDEGKYAAVIYSLASISKPVIGEKFKVLHKRISMIAVVSMLFKDDREITTHSRSDIILTNLKNEIMFYINTFELTPPVVQKLMEHSTFQMRDILCRSGEEIKKIVKNSLESKNEKIFSFPQMPSLFRESEILLNTILVGLQNDALYVFGQLPTFKGKVVEQENISISNV